MNLKKMLLLTPVQYLLTLFLGLVFGASFYINVFVLYELRLVIYKTLPAPEFTVSLFVIIPCIAGFTCACLNLFNRKAIEYKSWQTAWDFNKALLPLLILCPSIVLPLGVYTSCLFVLGVGLSVFRIASIWPGMPAWEIKLCSRYNIIIVAAVSALLVCYYTWLQLVARDVLYLDYHDWGVYLNIIDNTLRGKWFYSDEAGRSFLGIHFIPGVILLLSPYVWLFRSEEAFFLLNSLLIFSGGIFIYLFARRMKINSGAALVLAIAVLFYSSLSNMIMTIFYGFHDIYTIFPLLFLFCWLWEEKRYKLATVIFLISLTIKETVPIFWLGMSVIIFITGQRKWGTFFFLFSLAYLLIVIKLVMPLMAFQDEYEYASRFINLGGSMTSVLLSPFLKPIAVFHAFFRPCNFYFFSMLLLPLGLLALCRPLLLLPGMVMLGAVCLQETDQLQNIGIHYQTEFVALNFVAAVLAFRDIEQGKIFILHRWLLCGFSDRRSLLNRSTAALSGILVFTFLCNYFFGFIPYGKNDVLKITTSPATGPEIKAVMEKLIPPRASITSVLHCRFAGYFVLRNKVTFFDNKLVPPGEYVMLDLDDPLSMNYADAARKNFLLDPNYGIIFNGSIRYRHVMLFGRGKNIPLKSPMQKMTESQWQDCGESIETNNPAFSMRCKDELKNGKVSLQCAVRVERKVGADVNINFKVRTTTGIEYASEIFGNGIFPADFATPGDVYSFSVQLNTPPEKIDSIGADIIFRTPENTARQ